MKKNTLSLKCKVRWLKTKPLLLILFGFLFSFFGANAQTCSVMTNDFLEDFESATPGASVPTSCWTRNVGGGYYYAEVASWMSYSGNNSYYYELDSGGYVTLISPETDNLGDGEKQLRFYVYYEYGNDPLAAVEVYTMDDNTSTATKTLIQSIPMLSANQYTWKEYIVPLPDTDDDYFAISYSSSGKNYWYGYLDEIYYEDLSPCFFPMNIEVSDITANEATISWDTSIDANVTGYEYEIRTSGEPGSGATGLADNGTTTNTEVDIINLDAATTYYVYVRSVCGTSKGMWTIYPVSFMTLCPVFDDFFEGFESTALGGYGNPTVPNCWTHINTRDAGNGYPYAGGSSSYVKTGSRSYHFFEYYYMIQAGDFMLISPETDNLGSGYKRVRFSLYNQAIYNGTLELQILTLDSNTATANKTVVETITVNTSVPSGKWVEFSVPLPNTTDDYFAFSIPAMGGTGQAYLYLDDVYYEDIPLHELSFTKFDNICFGDSKGAAVVNVTEGLPPFTYSWSPVTGNATAITDLPAGDYIVTVIDALNRSVTDTVTILDPPQVQANIETSNISCNGQSDGGATINPVGGVGPYAISWSMGGTTNSVTGLDNGQYFVNITDANGCSVTEYFDILEPDALVASTGAHNNVSAYLAGDGSVTVAVTGGTEPYSYSWSHSSTETSDTASNLTPGTYTVTVTDAEGCSTTHSFVITQPIPLAVSLVSKEDVTCNGGNDGKIVVDVVGDYAPYTLAWSPAGGTGYTASNLTAGTYSVLVTNSIGETVTGTYAISEPSAVKVSVGAIGNVTCNGQNTGSATVTVTGGVAPYAYVWSNGATTQTVNNLSAGSNFVYVTDSNGCSTQQNFNITEPNAMVVNASSITHVSCNGQSDGAITVAVTGGTAPYTYSWSNNKTGTNIDNLSGGSYTVTVTDKNGCTKTQTFTINAPSVVHPPIAVNQGFCSDSNPKLSDMVITGSNIQWYNAATGGNALPMTTTLTNGATYYASQTVGGCESSSRTAVQVSLYQSAPLTSTTKDVCYNSVIQDVIIDGYNYNQLKWYSSATSTVSLAPNTLLTSTTYYISTFTNNVCESTKKAVQVTVAMRVSAPIVAPQSVCGSGHTLDDLTVSHTSGATLIWYTSAQATTPVPSTTQALSGTYYVEQMIGSCKSVRVAVPVQVTPVTAPTMTDIITCSGTTIADFNAQVAPTKYVWYINNTTTTSLEETTMISSGTFYIAEDNSGCISNRTQVNVVVNQRPNKPTGQTIQLFTFAATVANLTMNQPGVIWFGSEADALAQKYQLPSNTPLVNNKKYYGILTGGNNCASLPTEVEVRLSVSTNNFDLTNLKYYPNPTDSELNISYVETITKVEVFNIAGQRVLSEKFDANEVKVDLSGFGSGTYMVRIETETASQFVKVVKK